LIQKLHHSSSSIKSNVISLQNMKK